MYLKNFGEFFLNQVEHADTIIVSKLDKIQEKLNTIMLFKGCAMLNANVKLLLDSLVIKIERR